PVRVQLLCHRNRCRRLRWASTGALGRAATSSLTALAPEPASAASVGLLPGKGFHPSPDPGGSAPSETAEEAAPRLLEDLVLNVVFVDAELIESGIEGFFDGLSGGDDPFHAAASTDDASWVVVSNRRAATGRGHRALRPAPPSVVSAPEPSAEGRCPRPWPAPGPCSKPSTTALAQPPRHPCRRRRRRWCPSCPHRASTHHRRSWARPCWRPQPGGLGSPRPGSTSRR